MSRGITAPAIDGNSTSAEYSIGGPYAYANGYWYISHTAPKAPVQALTYDFWLYVPSGSENAPQAIEFECQHLSLIHIYLSTQHCQRADAARRNSLVGLRQREIIEQHDHNHDQRCKLSLFDRRSRDICQRLQQRAVCNHHHLPAGIVQLHEPRSHPDRHWLLGFTYLCLLYTSRCV